MLLLAKPDDAASAQSRDSTQLYSLLSSCSILITSSGSNALLEMDGLQIAARLEPDPYSREYVQLKHGKRPLLLMSTTEEPPFILNDKYQHGCEASRVILLHDPAVSAAGTLFRRYLEEHDYLFADSSAILRKARFMQQHGWHPNAAVLLEMLTKRRPETISAYLMLADAYDGMSGQAEKARTAYEIYRKLLEERFGTAARPEPRSF